MRKLTIIGRAAQIGVQGFVRQAWLTAAAVLVMTVSLAIVLSTIIVYFSTQSAVSELSKDLQQTIYLKEGVEASDTTELQQQIIANPGVVDIDFITPAEGRQAVISYDPELAAAFEVLGDEDVLQPVIRVTLSDIDQIDAVIQITQSSAYDDLVSSLPTGSGGNLAQAAISRAQNVRDFAVMASIVLSLVFAGLSCLIIFNTIRIAIFSRRQEIEIMRLVGARPEFIRASFIVESCLAGFLAGLLAVVLTYAVLATVGDWAQAQPEFVAAYDLFQQPKTTFQMIAGSISAGVLAGLASAYWATRRYLKSIN